MLRLHWDSGTHDLRDTGAMLYQLSYEASLEALILSLSYTHQEDGSSRKALVPTALIVCRAGVR